MTVVSLYQSHIKTTLGWQKKNRRKGIITVKIHSTDFYMRRQLSYVWYLKKILDVTPNLKWSVVRRGWGRGRYTLFKYLKKVFFVFVKKIGCYNLSKTTQTIK